MPAVYLLRHGQASFGGADYDVLSTVGEQQAKVLGAELNRREVPVHAVWSGTLRRQVDTAAGCLAELGVATPVRQDPRWDEYDHLGLVSRAGNPAHNSAAQRVPGRRDGVAELLHPDSLAERQVEYNPVRETDRRLASRNLDPPTYAPRFRRGAPVAGGHGEIDPADPAAAARVFQERLDEALRSWLTDGRPVGAMGTWAEFTGRITAAVSDAVAGLPRGGTALVFTSAGVISAVCAGLLHLPPAGYLALNRTMANASITKLVSGRSGTTLVSFNEHGHFEGPHRDLLTYR